MKVWASNFEKIRFRIVAALPAVACVPNWSGCATPGGLKLDKHLIILRRVAAVTPAAPRKEEIKPGLDTFQNGRSF